MNLLADEFSDAKHMRGTVSTDDKPRRARKRAESRRWVREVQGIAALVVAGFGVVALATFDPRQVPAHQESLAGPVGLWLRASASTSTPRPSTR